MADGKSAGQIIREEGVKFLAVGVVSALLAAWFQYAGWVRDTGNKRVEKGIENALSTFDFSTKLFAERWYATFRLLALFENFDRAEFEAREKIYQNAVTQWNLSNDLLLSKIEMFLDRARGEAAAVSLNDIARADCRAASHERIADRLGNTIGNLDPVSFKARHMLLGHCMREITAIINPVLRELRRHGEPTEDHRAAAKKAMTALEHLVAHANTQRRKMIEEIIFLRESATRLDFLPWASLKPPPIAVDPADR
jgi:hypothetical protein